MTTRRSLIAGLLCVWSACGSATTAIVNDAQPGGVIEIVDGALRVKDLSVDSSVATRDLTTAPDSQGADDAGSLANTCGNGLLDRGESCDTAISAGKGACPKGCTKGKCASEAKLLNAGTCQARCVETKITQCKNNDGCCPTGCSSQNDSDCASSSGTCGNGVLDPGERCDIAINTNKLAGFCSPCRASASCMKARTIDPGTCQQRCEEDPITSCSNDDGCCPAGCNATNDNDCCSGCRSPLNGGGYTCEAGNQTSACGLGGGDCKTCTTTAVCKQAACSNGQCGEQTAANGTSCTTNNKGGRCQGGQCCTGCLTGNYQCLAGLSKTQCGKQGQTCVECKRKNECYVPACVGGTCDQIYLGEGATCKGFPNFSICVFGKCCRKPPGLPPICT